MSQATKRKRTDSWSTKKQPRFGDITFHKMFPDEDAARDYLIQARWPNGVICPHCGHDESYWIKTQKRFKCKSGKCKKQFSVMVGTCMQDSKIPLLVWLWGMHRFGMSPKGVASTVFQGNLEITQKSAWFVNHRFREGFVDEGIRLEGIVECDFVFIGGVEKNKHANKKARNGRGPVNKIPVLVMKQRNGKCLIQPVTSRKAKAIAEIINTKIVKGAKLYTDEDKSFVRITHPHEVIVHSQGEFVRGDVTTNSAESINAMIKRSHMGIHHSWSRQHLHRYMGEMAWRHNTRDLPSYDRSKGDGLTKVGELMARMDNKRLKYHDLIDRPPPESRKKQNGEENGRNESQQ